MEERERLSSRVVFVLVMALVCFAIFTNFLIIIQSLAEPFKVIRRSDENGIISEMDVVVPKAGEGDNLQVGDVVVFLEPKSDGVYSAFQVQGFQRDDRGLDCALVMTDSGLQPVPLRDAVGKAWLVLPKGGFLLDFVRTPRGFLLCVISPWILLITYLISGTLRGKRLQGHNPLLRRSEASPHETPSDLHTL